MSSMPVPRTLCKLLNTLFCVYMVGIAQSQGITQNQGIAQSQGTTQNRGTQCLRGPFSNEFEYDGA